MINNIFGFVYNKIEICSQCDQLIKTEMRKSEDLMTLLKLREKSLVDRFKGQIAWLERQKRRYKEAGFIEHAVSVKKKQRALLLRLNDERKELQRAMKERMESGSGTVKNKSNINYNISHMSANMSIRRTTSTTTTTKNHLDGTQQKRAVKAIELPGGSTLEM